MAKERYSVDEHKKSKAKIREKLKNMILTKDNQRIYHELMENL